MILRKLISFIVGVFIFSVLPLVGWGLNDISGFIHNPCRLAYILMMAVLSVFVVIFVLNEGRSRGEGKKPVKRQKLSLLFLQIIPPIIILIAPFFDHRGIGVFNESSSLRLAGLILSFTGVSLVFLSQLSIILLIVLLFVLLWRIKDEEDLMHKEFKKDWEDYKKQSYALVPFIY
jgi:hypothetical protein